MIKRSKFQFTKKNWGEKYLVTSNFVDKLTKEVELMSSNLIPLQIIISVQ